MMRRSMVAAIACLLFLSNLGARDLWAPDEPYFAEGAREMVVDGEWLVPHVNGVVTTDKPPLFFWTIAVLSLAAGAVTPWTARLPSALAALGTLLLVMRLSRRFDGERTAWLAGLVLISTLMFWDKAHWAQIDSLLCFTIWMALSAFEACRAGEAAGARAGVLFWLAAAVAVLAKGPVGLLLPLGIAVLVTASDPGPGRWRRLASPIGPLLFVLVVGAWAAAATAGSGGEYSVWGALEEHFVHRGLHGLHHRQPPWYYLQVLPLHLLPWSGLVPGALVLAWRRRADPADRFLLVASLFVVLFFSISTEKRDLYVLPAVPAFALMVARLIDRLAALGGAATTEGAIGRRWLLLPQAALAVPLIVIGIALPFLDTGEVDLPRSLPVALGSILLVTGAVTLWACRRSHALAAATTPAAGFLVAYLFTSAFVYPALESRKSARPFAERMKAATESSRAAGHPVLAFDLGNLPEAFAFYGDGLYTVETRDARDLARHLRQPHEVWAVVHRPALDELPTEVRDDLSIVHRTRLSRRDILLVTNRRQRGQGTVRPRRPDRNHPGGRKRRRTSGPITSQTGRPRGQTRGSFVRGRPGRRGLFGAKRSGPPDSLLRSIQGGRSSSEVELHDGEHATSVLSWRAALPPSRGDGAVRRVL